MHYGWPLLRNLTLLSILTQWYSNNRKCKHNIQTTSSPPPPLYYPCYTEWAQICFLDSSLGRQCRAEGVAAGDCQCSWKVLWGCGLNLTEVGMWTNILSWRIRIKSTQTPLWDQIAETIRATAHITGPWQGMSRSKQQHAQGSCLDRYNNCMGWSIYSVREIAWKQVQGRSKKSRTRQNKQWKNLEHERAFEDKYRLRRT